MDNGELEEKPSRWHGSLRRAAVVWLSEVPRNPGPKRKTKPPVDPSTLGRLPGASPAPTSPAPTSPAYVASSIALPNGCKPRRPVCCPGRALRPSTTNGNIKITQYNGRGGQLP